MPTIFLGPEDSNLAATRFDRVWATMLYPMSTERQQAYMHYRHDRIGRVSRLAAELGEELIEHARSAAGHGDGHRPDFRPAVWSATSEAKEHDGGQDAADLTRTRETEELEAKRGEARGRIAGFILSFMLSASSEPTPRHKSIQKARFVAERVLQRIPKDERVIGVSQVPVRNAWKQYQSVAHLWAGMMLADEQGLYDDLDDQPTYLDLLSWGEHLLAMAQTLGIAEIDPTKAWRPDSEIELPESKLEIRGLAGPVLAALEDYDSQEMSRGRTP